MKKLIVLTSLFLLVAKFTNAQENCKMCGTWVGSYNYYYYDDDTGTRKPGKFNKYIRIQKYGENYKIRMKTIFTDKNLTTYDDDVYRIIETTDNSIYMVASSRDLTPNYKNDRISYYTAGDVYYLITYLDGYIHFKLVKEIDYEYDRNRGIR